MIIMMLIQYLESINTACMITIKKQEIWANAHETRESL